MANSFVAIADLFPPQDRGKYQGLVAAVFGLSSVIGPTAGGFITDNISWHWVFFVNVPVSVPVIALFVRYFPETRRRTRDAGARLDYPGMTVLILAVVPLLIGLSVGGVQYEWVSPQVIGALAFGSAMSIVFVFIESRASEPIMPLEIYRNRMVWVSLVAIFLTGFGMFGAIIFVPLFFQGVLGASATSSGSFLTPMMLGVVFGAALSGQVLSRTGGRYRVQALVGVSIMGVGLYLVSQMTEATGFGRAVVNIIILGFGLGATFPTYTLAVQNSVPFSVMGVATSATQFFRSAGGLLGLAVMGAVMAARFSSRMSEAVPDSLAQVIGAGQLQGLQSNPQSLVNPDALARLRTGIEGASPQGAAMVDQLLAIMKSSLSQAIGDVFLISVAVVALAFVATIFLRRSGVESHGEFRVAPVTADDD
jgi:MFS family permease